VFFLNLFPGRALGAELAAIFAIFTSQAWNMAFSFYQSLQTLPQELTELCQSFRFSPWQRFWRLEVPFAVPGLVWNMMMSMSGGWFFVVASEAISVGDKQITLPGIGSYVATAVVRRDGDAIGMAVVAMSLVIVIYDQILFRPLAVWADGFRVEQTAGIVPHSWFLDLLRRSPLMQAMVRPVARTGHSLLLARALNPHFGAMQGQAPGHGRTWNALWYLAVACVALWAVGEMTGFLIGQLRWRDVTEALLLGSFTLARVLLLILAAAVIWVPLGVIIGLRPRLAAFVQPVAQFAAAFPVNLLFPVAVFAILRWRLDPNIWLSPLMILGTQWYILFNVIAGAAAYPTDLLEAAAEFRFRSTRWWRQAILPGILPYFVTGAITASGGAWNASIVAETVSWGNARISAQGIGAYIARNTAVGDYPRIVLGIAVMSLLVIVINRFVWRPLYAYAERRSHLA
jgi:NitT/TauT family transport system permease protein